MSKFENTIVIWDQVGEDPIAFFEAAGDQTHLNGLYINSSAVTKSQLNELNALIFDEDYNYKLEKLTSFPYDKYTPGQTAVIVAGFLP